MKLVKWKFRDLEIMMVEDAEGTLYCTSNALCAALGIKAGHLRKLLHDNKGYFDPLRVTDGNAKGLSEFVRQEQVQLGIRRMRTDLTLWTLDDALRVAYIARTDVSWEFIQASIELVKQQALAETVSKTAYEALVAEQQVLTNKVGHLETAVAEMRVILELSASGAGRDLQAQKATKKLREMN